MNQSNILMQLFNCDLIKLTYDKEASMLKFAMNNGTSLHIPTTYEIDKIGSNNVVITDMKFREVRCFYYEIELLPPALSNEQIKCLRDGAERWLDMYESLPITC